MGINISNIKAIFRDSNGNKRNEFVNVLNTLYLQFKDDADPADDILLEKMKELLDLHFIVEEDRYSPINELSKDILISLVEHPANNDSKVLQDIADHSSADLEVYEKILSNSSVSDNLRLELIDKIKVFQQSIMETIEQQIPESTTISSEPETSITSSAPENSTISSAPETSTTSSAEVLFSYDNQTNSEKPIILEVLDHAKIEELIKNKQQFIFNNVII